MPEAAKDLPFSRSARNSGLFFIQNRLPVTSCRFEGVSESGKTNSLRQAQINQPDQKGNGI